MSESLTETLTKAIQRFEENEARVQTFTNTDDPGYYQTNLSPSRKVETLPHFINRIRDRYLTILWRGEWAPNTAYGVNDVVAKPGEPEWWICALPFTSSETFQEDVDLKRMAPFGLNIVSSDANCRRCWKADVAKASGSILTLPL